MMRGLWKLTWLELKIFLREPMGAIGSIALPVLVFVMLSRGFGGVARRAPNVGQFLAQDLPVLVTILIALSSALSLITIVSIYREGGILKRLRATPLSPLTILTSHVLVKLALSVVTLSLLALVGKRFYNEPLQVNPLSFVLALILVTMSILSLGFVIASLVPTARFAQPLGSLLLYPQVAISGLFFNFADLPTPLRALFSLSPLTHGVALLRGLWLGGSWGDHLAPVAALVAIFVACTALASRVFRWE